MQPRGRVERIPWRKLFQVECTQDNSVYITTTDNTKYYLRLMDSVRPSVDAWMWATRLCQLTKLLGHTVTGYVAMFALGIQAIAPLLSVDEEDE